jgi:hypothetical protein
MHGVRHLRKPLPRRGSRGRSRQRGQRKSHVEEQHVAHRRQDLAFAQRHYGFEWLPSQNGLLADRLHPHKAA